MARHVREAHGAGVAVVSGGGFPVHGSGPYMAGPGDPGYNPNPGTSQPKDSGGSFGDIFKGGGFLSGLLTAILGGIVGMLFGNPVMGAAAGAVAGGFGIDKFKEWFEDIKGYFTDKPAPTPTTATPGQGVTTPPLVPDVGDPFKEKPASTPPLTKTPAVQK